MQNLIYLMILIALLIITICIIVVIIDYHKYWLLIEKQFERENKND